MTDRVYIPQNGLLKQILSYGSPSSTSPSVQNLEYHLGTRRGLRKAERGQSQVLTHKTRRSILWSNGQTVAHRVSWRDLSRA